ncbi:FAD-dependent oxidoreductase [Mesorhizobium sp.]|uniref:NAD(P)/FAD-dependent oxidoreductase n=1 Tax=Mesorhizobium sp. TaxID=1871066 RepID=UPI000FE7051E|nr:FAD-dependent oxidoreductase [Mesorhizobium sp.]RWG07762.1 MAG: FAD-binding oxidoreductase [Mesorhizobium sp.]RWH02926.1 MAG: FAD-binding oxidoreductase [Mesorhizobium sp.]RWI16471.1 MAG: FAD-binding oxidoreductase [Mesorhizobium sp.]RWN08499.1 MAG: FAD-binding oxidoreductase [Mesorhizobium sp.]RWN08683.1 MAG: FAD-binding oxidoreductase [Mesorhizobium sp.]
MSTLIKQSQALPVAVIGSGVVGLCIARQLQMRGSSVILCDPSEPGSGTSSGNAAVFATSQCFPLAMPGIVRRVPKMLLDPLGPLAIRLAHAPHLTPWLSRFLWESRPRRAADITTALAGLLMRAMPAWEALLGTAINNHTKQQGWLYVWQNEVNFAAASVLMERRRALGIRVEKLSKEAAIALEPALTSDIVGGYFYPDITHTIDPLKLCQAVAADFFAAGGQQHRARARGFRIEDGEVTGVATESGIVACRAVAIAAGPWSRELAMQLGDRFLVESERGYHADISHPAISITRPVGSTERSFVVTPLSDRLRIAGTAEFAGLKRKPDMRRAARLVENAKRLFPSLAAPEYEPWMGQRSSTPDSLPIIEPSKRVSNAYYAFGHGHLGLTLAAVTGALVASWITSSSQPAQDFAATSQSGLAHKRARAIAELVSHLETVGV